ncbi:hypothetical protein AAC387_Pa01g1831 [Persea americana]
MFSHELQETQMINSDLKRTQKGNLTLIGLADETEEESAAAREREEEIEKETDRGQGFYMGSRTSVGRTTGFSIEVPLRPQSIPSATSHKNKVTLTFTPSLLLILLHLYCF